VKFLEFISFNQWQTILDSNTIGKFSVVLTVFIVFTAIKTIGLIFMDSDNHSGSNRKIFLLVLVRIIQNFGGATLFLMFLVLFQNINVVIYGMIFFGIYCAVTLFLLIWDSFDHYLIPTNKYIFNFVCNSYDNVRGSYKSQKKLNQINKTIYDYRKGAVIK
jgi:hypothetical protein